MHDDKYKHALREHCTSVGYFLGVAPVRDKCVVLVWIGNRQLRSQVLICDRWFKMPGIGFVPCHSAKIDAFTVLFLPLPSARKIGIDYFCHLVLLEDKGWAVTDHLG